jgi:hypothetical protein
MDNMDRLLPVACSTYESRLHRTETVRAFRDDDASAFEGTAALVADASRIRIALGLHSELVMMRTRELPLKLINIASQTPSTVLQRAKIPWFFAATGS